MKVNVVKVLRLGDIEQGSLPARYVTCQHPTCINAQVGTLPVHVA